MDSKRNTPELRFPEFKDEWTRHILGEIATFSKGKGVSKAEISDRGELECIRYGELYTVYGETITDIRSKTHLKADECVLSQSNDVIIPASGETQLDIATASCVLRSGIALGGDLNIIRSPLNGVFLAYYLNTKKKQEIASLAQGISVVHLYSSQLKTLILNIPSDTEQNKIAAFLTAVDDKIQLLEKKKGLLEQYKKGVMQKIFNREVRFKDDDGKDFPDWCEKKLGSIADVTKLAGYEFTKHVVYKDTGTIVALRGLNIKLNKLDLAQVKYIDGSQLEKLDRSKLFVNDLMFTYVGTIGEVALIPENDRFYLAPNVARIRAVEDEVHANYLLQYFTLDSFKNREIANYIATSSQPALSMENVRKFRIALPCLKEQAKIATFLGANDDKINHVSRQLELTRQYKKGLLQQMFV